jgi:demethylspheroidene O-methyltransferase
MTSGSNVEGRARALLDGLFNLRNRVLSSPGFQRSAAGFWPTRWVAQRRASQLFNLCAGFVYSQVLLACVRVGLFTALAPGPCTLAELATRVDLPLDGLRRLLDAAVSLELAQRCSGDRYGLGVHGAAFLGNPGVALMVEHHAMVYRDLADPVALLRGQKPRTELSAFWSYAGTPQGPPAGSTAAASTPAAGPVAAYSELMAGSVSLIAEDILEAYPLDQHKHLMDVGGGEGAFVEAAAARTPHLALTLFDLPAVAQRAAQRADRNGLSGRLRVVGGNVFSDPLPKGPDVISLTRVLHDHDDAAALQILRAVRQALPPGGRVLVAEPMAETPGAEAMGDAYFGFYLLAMGQGRPRTPAALGTLLTQAGFGRVEPRLTRRPMLTGVIIGTGV